MASFRSWKTMVSPAELMIWVEITRCNNEFVCCSFFFILIVFLSNFSPVRTLFRFLGSLLPTIIWHLNATGITIFCLPQSYSFIVPSLHKGFSRFLSLSLTHFIFSSIISFFWCVLKEKNQTHLAASFADNHAFHLHSQYFVLSSCLLLLLFIEFKTDMKNWYKRQSYF